MAVYLLPVFAYLLGSVSSAIVVARVMGIEDPRKVGSGNPGATNILRYGGRLAAGLTLLGDILKGAVPVVAARLLTEEEGVIAATGFSVFLGHLYPVFFGFRGGKGVATTLGVWLALSPAVGAALLLTWFATAAITRYSSLAALAATVAAPVYVAWFTSSAVYVGLMLVMGALLVWHHRSNIRNLLSGRESKIGRRRET
jgi:glycerol-3-phosphate acyltransferase PlsY